MNEHLTLDEIIQAVNRSPESLSPRHFTHLNMCESCQKTYRRQLSANRILKNVHPKKAPQSLALKVVDAISKISPVKVRQKTDWLFLGSIILLFSMTSWYVFSGKASTLIKEYAPGVVAEKDIVEPGVIDTIKDEVFLIKFRFNLPDLNLGNIYLAVGILVIFIYMLIDRKIIRNFKVHKT